MPLKNDIFHSRVLTSTVGITILSSIMPDNQQIFASTPEQPNIIWIVFEDISPYLGCYGDSVAITPNLDQLASEGVRFTNVYSVSGVSAPSRSALITGCYPTAIGTHNMRTQGTGSKPDGIVPYEAVTPPDVRMFTQYLRESGYYCINRGKRDFQFGVHRTAWDRMTGSIDWNNINSLGKPFFLYHNDWMITHESSMWKDYSRVTAPEIDPADVVLPPYYPDNPVVRQDVAKNYSNIAEADVRVGNILDKLKNNGLLEQSIIVFFSDHGGPLPRGKREIYDSGLRVPLIIRFPNKEHAGTVVDDLISFVDFAPTMLSLAGAPIPESIQGQAFWGDQKADTARKYIYAARDRMDTRYDIRRAVRDKRFKYIRNYKPEIGRYQVIDYRLNMDMMNEMLRLRDSGWLNQNQMHYFATSKPPEELYDTWNDPYELNNLAEDPAYADTLARFQQAHQDFENKYQDLGFTPEPELLETFWPGFVQPVTSMPSFNMKNDSVVITCADTGATIAYQLVTKNGGTLYDAWDKWSIYTKPVYFPEIYNIYAVAHRIGYKESAIANFSSTGLLFNGGFENGKTGWDFKIDNSETGSQFTIEHDGAMEKDSVMLLSHQAAGEQGMWRVQAKQKIQLDNGYSYNISAKMRCNNPYPDGKRTGITLGGASDVFSHYFFTKDDTLNYHNTFIWKKNSELLDLTFQLGYGGEDINAGGALAYDFYLDDVRLTRHPTIVPTSAVINEGNVGVQTDSTVQLTAHLLPAEADQLIIWRSDNELIARISDGLVTGGEQGSTYVYAKAKYYQDIIDSVLVTVNPEGVAINTTKNNHYAIYPNPVKNALHIKNLVGDGIVSICNIHGQLMYQGDFDISSKINFKRLPDGIYYLSIEKPLHKTQTYKIIKK
jgi:arylsulfatase A-like enzyme